MELDLIYKHDSATMPEVEDESVQLIVTSPEYYGSSMWKHNSSFDEYVRKLESTWSECFRALKPDGKMVVNVADLSSSTAELGRRKIYPTHSRIIESCERIGFDYFDYAIWYKPHRHVNKVYGSYPYPTNFQFYIVVEYLLVFRKWVSPEYFKRRRLPGHEVKESSCIGEARWRSWAHNVWDITPVIKIDSSGKNRYGHIAPFPEEIPRRFISAYSFVGDVVLDPFMGSGTVAKVARELGRHYIGYELDADYAALAERKIASMDMFARDRSGRSGSGGASDLGMATSDKPRRRSKKSG